MILSILVKIDAVTPVTQPGWMLRASLGELPKPQREGLPAVRQPGIQFGFGRSDWQ